MKRTQRIALASVAALMFHAGCASSDASEKDPEERAPLTKPADVAQQEPEAKQQEPAEQPSKQASAKTDAKPMLRAVGPIAFVDGEAIPAEKFNHTVARRASAMGGKIPPPMVQMLKKRTLDRLIDEHLIDRELAQADVAVDQGAIDKEFAKVKDRFPSDQAFKSFLNQNSLSSAQMRENLRKDLKLREVLADKYGIRVTDQDVRDYYDANPTRFEREAQVQARHILIKVDKNASTEDVEKARQRADELSQQAKAGDDFAELAKKHSEGPSARRGGDLGFFTKGRMVPEFAKAAFSMNPGEVSGPVRTSFGFHVIKVEATKPAGKVPFAEAEELIESQLERQKYRKAMQKFLAELEADAKIERHPENIEVNVEAKSGEQRQRPNKDPSKLRLPKPDLK